MIRQSSSIPYVLWSYVLSVLELIDRQEIAVLARQMYQENAHHFPLRLHVFRGPKPEDIKGTRVPDVDPSSSDLKRYVMVDCFCDDFALVYDDMQDLRNTSWVALRSRQRRTTRRNVSLTRTRR